MKTDNFMIRSIGGFYINKQYILYVITFFIVFTIFSLISLREPGNMTPQQGYVLSFVLSLIFTPSIIYMIGLLLKGSSSAHSSSKSINIIKNIKNPDNEVREDSIENLSDSSLNVQRKSVPHLINIINTTQDEEVKNDAEIALKKVKKYLINYSTNYSFERERIAKALIKIGDEESIKAAAKKIAPNLNENKEVQKKAVKILIKLANQGNNDSIEILAENIVNYKGVMNITAVNFIYKLGPDSVEPLIRSLRKENQINGTRTESYAYVATRILGKLGDPRAVDVLIETLVNPNRKKRVKNRAAKAIGRIGDKNAIEPLRNALKSEENHSIRNSILKNIKILEDTNIQSKSCPECGTINLKIANFCKNCGQELI